MDQLVILTNQIVGQFIKYKYTGLIIFDVEKVFDTLLHNGLMYKLIQYNFLPYLVFLINLLIRNTRMYIEYKNPKFEIQLIKAGVPHVSVLGPQYCIS